MAADLVCQVRSCTSPFSHRIRTHIEKTHQPANPSSLLGHRLRNGVDVNPFLSLARVEHILHLTLHVSSRCSSVNGGGAGCWAFRNALASRIGTMLARLSWRSISKTFSASVSDPPRSRPASKGATARWRAYVPKAQPAPVAEN